MKIIETLETHDYEGEDLRAMGLNHIQRECAGFCIHLVCIFLISREEYERRAQGIVERQEREKQQKKR
jgi:hypothetical protein